MKCHFVKSLFLGALLVVVGASEALSDTTGTDSPGTPGIPTTTQTSNTTNTTSSIFNRTTGGWTSTGWGTGATSGGLGGGGYRVGRNFVGVSTPDGSIGVGRNFVGSGSGTYGGLGIGYNDQINAAACTVLGIPMGSFGALVMSFAGIIAIVSGALGAYKMALSTIVVGAGSWILFPIVSMFFPVSCGF